MGLIERQLILGKQLYVCFVDFSRAFDLINRSILFFKMIKSGIQGRLVNTLRSLYDKTSFRIKCNNLQSINLPNKSGVNQGGNASPIMFREYMADLNDYMGEHCGICVLDTIIMHLLWADDLILMSETTKGLQTLLHGLEKFSSNNQTVVNDIKRK